MLEQPLAEPNDFDPAIGDAVRSELRRRNQGLNLHRWFDRRPLVMTRIATYLALTGGVDSKSDIVKELSVSEPTDATLTKVREQIQHALRGEPSKVLENEELAHFLPTLLDPFAGGGSVPLEAVRLGCQATSCELNPLGAAILRGTVDYPVRFAAPAPDGTEPAPKYKWKGLVAEFTHWFKELRSTVTSHWAKLYSADNRPRYYLWIRQSKCPNSSCHTSVPLSDVVELQAASSGSKPGLKAFYNGGRTTFAVTESTERRTRDRSVTCPVCGAAITSDKIASGKPLRTRAHLIAVAHGAGSGVEWAPANQESLDDVWELSLGERSRLEFLLQSKAGILLQRPLPEYAGFNLIHLGASTFADLFSPRQLLAGLELLDAATCLRARMRQEGMTLEHVDALSTYFAFGLGYLIQNNCVLTAWDPQRRRSNDAFSPQAYRFNAHFVEADPASVLDSWFDSTTLALGELTKLPRPTAVYQTNAETLPFEANSFDAIVTNPPHFDIIPYSDLTDFFWVWESHLIPEGSQLTFVQANTGLESIARIDRDDFAKRYQTGLLNCFRECFRVLKPSRLLCLFLTETSRPHFDAYVELSESAGFEIVSIQRLPDSSGSSAGVDHRTCLIYLRKPGRPSEHQGLATDAEVVLARFDRGQPVKFEAVAELLADNLDPIDIDRIAPFGSKGTPTEKLQEALAQQDPRELLRSQLGTATIRKIVRDKGLLTVEDREPDPVDALLMHFGFRIPKPGKFEGVHQAIEVIRRNASRLRQSTEPEQIIGLFTKGALLVETMIKRGVYGWAKMAFGNKCETHLKSILSEKGRVDADLSRLTFGQYRDLFDRLPDAISQSEFVDRVKKKLGRQHVYLPKRPKGNSLSDRIEKVIIARNKVAHNKEDPLSLREELVAVLDQAAELLRELAVEHAIPRVGIAYEQVRDMWGRLSYRIRLDDGSVFEGTFSDELDLGGEYFFFGSEVNPKPVDPILIGVEQVGPIP